MSFQKFDSRFEKLSVKMDSQFFLFQFTLNSRFCRDRLCLLYILGQKIPSWNKSTIILVIELYIAQFARTARSSVFFGGASHSFLLK